MYIAVRDFGAYRNGVRMLGCSGDKAARTLSNAVVCFELGYFSETGDRVDVMINAIKRLLEHGVRATRQLGSGVLDLCYVASGRMDVGLLCGTRYCIGGRVRNDAPRCQMRRRCYWWAVVVEAGI